MVSSKVKSLTNFLKNNWELSSLIGILVFSFIIRIFYLSVTMGQTLWWDEAEYMATAKHWAFGIDYNVNEQRPPIFQLLAAGLLNFGFGEIFLKFLLVVVPSVFLVLVIYLLGKEMFDQKIAIISSLGASLVWSILFWSSRFQPDFFSITLQLLAFLFYWKFINSNKKSHAIYVGIICATSFYFKISALLVPLSIFVFALYYEGWSIINKKNYWIIVLSFIISLIPFMAWQAISFGNPLAFGVSYSGDFNEGRDLGWMALSFYKSFLKTTTFVLFIIGLLITIFKTTLKADLIFKEKKLRRDPYIFSLIILLVVSLFYIFYIKGTIEDRWVFIIIPFSFFFASRTIFIVFEKLKNYSKIFAWVLIIIYLIFFATAQLNHTNNLVENKKTTYLPIKEASILIKDNSDYSDKVLSVSYTQATTYSERKVIPYPRMSIENFTEILNTQKPKYIMASIIEPNHPSWMVQQGQIQNGYYAILFPYFNSTIVLSPQGQIVNYDLKDKIIVNDISFNLIYPTKDTGFGGVVLYEADYQN